MNKFEPMARTADRPEQPPTLPPGVNDAVVADMIEQLLLKENFCELAERALALIHDKESPRLQRIHALIEFGRKNYDQCVELAGEFLKKNPRDVELLVVRANALFFAGHYEEGESAFLKAIRRGASDREVLERLGLIYVKQQKWVDAKTVFAELCRDPEFRPSAFA